MRTFKNLFRVVIVVAVMATGAWAVPQAAAQDTDPCGSLSAYYGEEVSMPLEACQEYIDNLLASGIDIYNPCPTGETHIVVDTNFYEQDFSAIDFVGKGKFSFSGRSMVFLSELMCLTDEMNWVSYAAMAVDTTANPAPATAAPAAEEMFVTARTLNVRRDASTTHARVGRLACGDEVEILDNDGDWAQIARPSGASRSVEYWIHADYISATEPSCTTAPAATASGGTEWKPAMAVGVEIHSNLRNRHFVGGCAIVVFNISVPSDINVVNGAIVPAGTMTPAQLVEDQAAAHGCPLDYNRPQYW